MAFGDQRAIASTDIAQAARGSDAGVRARLSPRCDAIQSIGAFCARMTGVRSLAPQARAGPRPSGTLKTGPTHAHEYTVRADSVAAARYCAEPLLGRSCKRAAIERACGVLLAQTSFQRSRATSNRVCWRAWSAAHGLRRGRRWERGRQSHERPAVRGRVGRARRSKASQPAVRCARRRFALG